MTHIWDAIDTLMVVLNWNFNFSSFMVAPPVELPPRHSPNHLDGRAISFPISTRIKTAKLFLFIHQLSLNDDIHTLLFPRSIRRIDRQKFLRTFFTPQSTNCTTFHVVKGHVYCGSTESGTNFIGIENPYHIYLATGV